MERSEINNSFLDSLLEGFQIIDFDWHYLYVNKTVSEQGMNTPEGLIGRTMMECYPGIEKTPLFAELKKCMEQRVALNFDNEFLYPDGKKKWFELRVEPVEQGIIILSSNITNRKTAEKELLSLKNKLEKKVKQRTAQLEKLNAEKDVILKEMHHRVKNNLQIISSLIRLQIEEGDHQFNGILGKTQSRIETIASIHESLYKHKDLTLIDVAGYWRDLFNDCLHSMVNEPSNYNLHLDFQNIHFSVDKMIPLGLLINELITNSILHGFKGASHGTIELTLKDISGAYRLTYKDDGLGIERYVASKNDSHFGHYLIEGLAEQLNGKFSMIQTGKGVHFELEFPC